MYRSYRENTDEIPPYLYFAIVWTSVGDTQCSSLCVEQWFCLAETSEKSLWTLFISVISTKTICTEVSTKHYMGFWQHKHWHGHAGKSANGSSRGRRKQFEQLIDSSDKSSEHMHEQLRHASEDFPGGPSSPTHLMAPCDPSKFAMLLPHWNTMATAAPQVNSLHSYNFRHRIVCCRVCMYFILSDSDLSEIL